MTVCAVQTGAVAVAWILRYLRSMDASHVAAVFALVALAASWASAELRARRLAARLRRAREERDRYRRWARAQDITRLPGWEHMAGVMSRWSDAVDDTDALASRED